MQSEKLHQIENWATLIITPEAMPRLLDTLRIHSQHNDFYEHCFLTLDFCNRNPSRHGFLNEKVLKIWDQMYGFGELRLTGNTDEVVGNHLKQHMESGPSEDNIVSYMEMFQSIAEDSYSRNDFATAYFYWHYLQRYWDYQRRLKERSTNLPTPLDRQPQSESHAKGLNVTAHKLGVSLFGISKILLRIRNYKLAARILEKPLDWLPHTWNGGIYRCITPILEVKLEFCRALALTADGHYEDGRSSIGHGVFLLRENSDTYAQRKIDDVFREFCKAIDNEMIEGGKRWRCGWEDKVGLKSKGGEDWQLHTGCLPFWDWLEIPGDEPGPEFLAEDYSLDFSGSRE
jgi:hypothetical protein